MKWNVTYKCASVCMHAACECARMCVELLLCSVFVLDIGLYLTLEHYLYWCVCVRTGVCMCVCLQVYVIGCRWVYTSNYASSAVVVIAALLLIALI